MSDDEVTESWFNITPSVLERLRAGGEDEEHFVRRTAEFLVQRQGVAAFPDIIELEDVIATYSDYLSTAGSPEGLPRQELDVRTDELKA